MKHNFLIAFLFYALLLMMLSSCTEKEPLPEIKLNQDRYAFSSMASSASLFITTNYDWTASSSSSWLTLRTAGGTAGTVSLFFDVSANETPDERTGVITIRCKDLSREITVVQQQQDVVAINGERELEFPSEGGTFEVSLSSNVDYEVQLPDWIAKVHSKALSQHLHAFTVSPNTGLLRTGTIEFRDPVSLKSDTIRITQFSRYYLLLITHQASRYAIPLLTGPSSFGYVDWGDGSSVSYAPSIAHDYSITPGRQFVVRLEMEDTHTVTFPTLTDIDAIDFSRF